MIKQPKFILFGVFILLGLAIGVIRYWPDGKLHIVFCDVGQGDAVYIKMPNQADILVDGGPNDRVLSCLGKFMPFYDRKLEVVVMSHPQKDHFQGLISVFKRYQVDTLVTIPLGNDTDSFKELITAIKMNHTPVRYFTTGDRLEIGEVSLETLWPEKNWLTLNISLDEKFTSDLSKTHLDGQFLGFTTTKDLNLFCLYLHLTYGQFDLFLTGDGDSGTQAQMAALNIFDLIPENLELLKVPHHGSRTGMNEDFIERVRPKISVITVGKNNYGHPNQHVIEKLGKWGKVLRTDLNGDIEIIVDKDKYWINRSRTN